MKADQITWFLHMDRLWMYRVHLALGGSKSIAMSPAFFHLEDAQRALAEAMHFKADLALAA